MRKAIASFLLVFFVAGCVGTEAVPQTPRERLVAAEATYQAALGTANDFVVQGLIVKGSENAIMLGSAIITARAALDAWHVVPDNQDRMITAISALKVLQATLNSLKTKLKGRPA